jgi:hypothetical protein
MSKNIRERPHPESNSQLKFIGGKLHKPSSKDAEVSEDEVNKTTIAYNSMVGIATCGRFDSSTDTLGSFDLYHGGARICQIVWNNP